MLEFICVINSSTIFNTCDESGLIFFDKDFLYLFNSSSNSFILLSYSISTLISFSINFIPSNRSSFEIFHKDTKSTFVIMNSCLATFFISPDFITTPALILTLASFFAQEENIAITMANIMIKYFFIIVSFTENFIYPSFHSF